MQLKKNSVSGRSGLLAAASVLAVLACQSLPAMAETGPAREVVAFSIPEQPLSQAIAEFSRQSRINVLVPSSVTAGRTSRAVTGEMTPDAALEALLEGSTLEVRRQKDGAYLVSQVQEARQEARPFQLDRPPAAADAGDRRRPSSDLNGERRLDQITVTGTNIRGIAPDSSPAKIFTRDDILVTGASTAQDFVRTLPANFGGGSNAGQAGLPNDTNAGFNSGMSGSLGSSVNLRGLGSDATLVLLNGHRLAPSSGIGDFVDISMIPASAIERVEVLTDGASSIYGGDAVAGVVNFVLREDFDGLEASLRHGSVTRGSFDETRASLTAGRAWGSGNGMFVYEYFSQSSLSSADREFSRSAPQPNDLMPSQERQSVLASVRQDLTPDLEAYLDVFYSAREAEQLFARTSGALNWSRPASENLNLAAGTTWTIGDWFLDASGTYSELSSEPNDLGTFPSASKVDSSIWSGDIKGSGSLFSLPGGEVKLAVGAHYRSEDFSNFRTSTNTQLRSADREVYAAFAEAFIPVVGPGNALPGIRRLELNLSGRVEDYSDFGSTADPKVGILWEPAENLKLRGSYSTSFNPPPLGRVPVDGSAPRFVEPGEGIRVDEPIGPRHGQLGLFPGGALRFRGSDLRSGDALILELAPGASDLKIVWRGAARIASLANTRDGAIFATFSDTQTPPDIVKFKPDLQTRHVLTSVNPGLAGIDPGSTFVFETTVPAHDGGSRQVRTMVRLPAGMSPGDRPPAIVFIYPNADYSAEGMGFGLSGNPLPAAAFTTRGYAVLYPFVETGPGGEAGNALQEIVDTLLPQVYRAADLGYVDIDRLAITGTSFGGYSTAGVISRTNLFRAAIAINGVYDLGGNYGALGRRGGDDMQADWTENTQPRIGPGAWSDIARLIENSPYYQARKIRTPLLLLQGREDVFLTEAQKLFVVLRRFGTPVQLAVYDGAGHSIADWPKRQAVDGTLRAIGFLDRYLK